MNEKMNIDEFTDLYCSLYVYIFKFLDSSYDKNSFYKKLKKAFSYCFEFKQIEYSKKLLRELSKWYLYDIIGYATLNKICINRLYSESVDLINKYLNGSNKYE